MAKKIIIKVNNPDFDCDKLAEAIVKAQQEAEEQKEILKQQKEEELEKESICKRYQALGCENDFDENGNPKNKCANIKLVWKFLWAKENFFKEIKAIDFCVNGLVSLFFALLEKLLYLTSIFLFGIGIANVFKVNTYRFQFAGELNNLWIGFILVLIAFALFFFTRTIIRAMKIDCKYNEDSNYMLNFLAVIVAIIAIIVSVFIR